jgi:hypothetical protein
LTLDDARRKLEHWRRDYNEVRPHSAIGNKPPISLMNGCPSAVSFSPENPPAGRSKIGAHLRNQRQCLSRPAAAWHLPAGQFSLRLVVLDLQEDAAVACRERAVRRAG